MVRRGHLFLLRNSLLRGLSHGTGGGGVYSLYLLRHRKEGGPIVLGIRPYSLEPEAGFKEEKILGKLQKIVTAESRVDWETRG